MPDLADQLAEILERLPGARAVILLDAEASAADGPDWVPADGSVKSHEEMDKLNPHTKEEVDYGLPEPADGDNRCGNCRHYSNRSCEVVSGPIEPDYICDEYSPAVQARDPDAYPGPGSHRVGDMPDPH